MIGSSGLLAARQMYPRRPWLSVYAQAKSPATSREARHQRSDPFQPRRPPSPLSGIGTVANVGQRALTGSAGQGPLWLEAVASIPAAPARTTTTASNASSRRFRTGEV